MSAYVSLGLNKPPGGAFNVLHGGKESEKVVEWGTKRPVQLELIVLSPDRRAVIGVPMIGHARMALPIVRG